ncbi:MAG: DUF3795 domain-containing protein [Syntrophomonadaceae bacterium]
MLSACGLVCDECDFFGKSCEGCPEVKGKPFWVKEMKVESCALYDCCVQQKSFTHCGHCSSLPCSMFLEYKDPNATDEEHARSLEIRIARLRAGV